MDNTVYVVIGNTTSHNFDLGEQVVRYREDDLHYNDCYVRLSAVDNPTDDDYWWCNSDDVVATTKTHTKLIVRVGEFWKRRDGKVVFIVSDDKSEKWPMCGVLLSKIERDAQKDTTIHVGSWYGRDGENCNAELDADWNLEERLEFESVI